MGELKNSKDFQLDKRMGFLDFLLAYRGWFTRQDLMKEFKVAPAGATRDISEYRKLASKNEDEVDNVSFDDSIKRYVRTESFQAKYPISFERGISLLRRALKKGYIGVTDSIPLESPVKLSKASADTLAILSRAISNKVCVSVKYGSLSSGDTSRIIFPHALFESETNWYVRAFCDLRKDFITFKLARFLNLNLINEERTKNSDPIRDDQWQRWVNLVLEPHKNRKKDVLARDYGMGKIEKNGVVISECAKEVKVRAAICGFWLQHWNVDCSAGGTLGEKDLRYQLQLANPETLYDVESADMAPGRNQR